MWHSVIWTSFIWFNLHFIYLTFPTSVYNSESWNNKSSFCINYIFFFSAAWDPSIWIPADWGESASPRAIYFLKRQQGMYFSNYIQTNRSRAHSPKHLWLLDSHSSVGNTTPPYSHQTRDCLGAPETTEVTQTSWPYVHLPCLTVPLPWTLVKALALVPSTSWATLVLPRVGLCSVVGTLPWNCE